jgi:hypothetical protein
MCRAAVTSSTPNPKKVLGGFWKMQIAANGPVWNDQEERAPSPAVWPELTEWRSGQTLCDTLGASFQPEAGMAELADAADSKSADRKVVGVRPPLPAPTKSIRYETQAPSGAFFYAQTMTKLGIVLGASKESCLPGV